MEWRRKKNSRRNQKLKGKIVENKNLLKECLEYFAETPVLKKALKLCTEKYRSFGEVRGTVVLRGLNQKDIEDLEGFTGKNYHGKKSASLSTSLIQKSIDESKFSGVALDALVNEYYSGILKSKKQEKIDKDDAAEKFFAELAKAFAGTKSGEWLHKAITEQTDLYRMLCKKYRDKAKEEGKDPKSSEEHFRKEMHIWLSSLNHLPVFENTYEYMPVFAASMSGNPHYYDERTEYILLLYYAINDMLGLGRKVASAMPAEEKHSLLLQAGLIRDDVSNDVMVYGIKAWKKDGEHLGIAGFYKQKEPLSLALSTVIQLTSVQCDGGIVYAVENPSVFTKLIQEDKSVLCVNGQPNLAVLLLLDLIVKNGGQIYYNGDFDPEGLLIAQRLKNRYAEGLSLWHYTEEDFQKSLSKQTLSDRRLKMLDNLSSPELVEVGEMLIRHKKAGYQENIFF